MESKVKLKFARRLPLAKFMPSIVLVNLPIQIHKHASEDIRHKYNHGIYSYTFMSSIVLLNLPIQIHKLVSESK